MTQFIKNIQISDVQTKGVTDSGDAASMDVEDKISELKKLSVENVNKHDKGGGDAGESTDEDGDTEENTADNIPDITIDSEGNYYIVSSDDENDKSESANQDSGTPDNKQVANGLKTESQPSAQSDNTPEIKDLNGESESIGNAMNLSGYEDSVANGASEKSDNKSGMNETVSETADHKSEAEKEEERDREMSNEPLDILGNGLLIKKIITPAEDLRSRPTYGDIVTLKSEGVLDNGFVIDKHEQITFTVGDGDVIQAWDLCTALMGVGEVCELTTDAKYAYGTLGSPPSVPAGAKITYTLELLKKEPPLNLSTLSVEDRLRFGDEKRERGNYLFGRTDYAGAINSYSKALKILDDESSSHSEDTSLLQKLLDTKMKCYNNIGAAQLKVEAYDAAIKSCDEVLKVQPENVKALFRKGKAHASKGNTELAITVLKKAVQLDPESKIVQQELFKQTKKLKKETESEKEMYMKMFGSKKSTSAERKKSTNQWKTWALLAVGSTAAVLLSVGIAAYRNMKN